MNETDYNHFHKFLWETCGGGIHLWGTAQSNLAILTLVRTPL